ncbi:MAG: peptide chain release factor N(5)-glutamine methyltransferase [Planctomycetes bacterium]|nr:peptide chain release factor N(5)-glutamine methyltransferase [Planctomycetota bacterium]
MVTEACQKSEWSIKRLLEWTSAHFANAEVNQPRLCAELLLAYVLGCQRIDLYVKFDSCPEESQLSRYRELVKRCVAHEPVAYLTGKAHFFGLEFVVNSDCLIPRPETETLVAQAIDFCRHQTHRPTVDVLDLCSGSGCVAIAIAANVVEAEIIAVDNSSGALEIARKNVEVHDLQGRITLLESDLFEQVDTTGKGVFDLIVSNPPYISAREYEKLDRMIRDYEPKVALWAGVDGLDVIRRMVADAERFLADDGAIMIEMAYDQAEDVKALFEEADYLAEIRIVQDSIGHPRVVVAKRKDS